MVLAVLQKWISCLECTRRHKRNFQFWAKQETYIKRTTNWSSIIQNLLSLNFPPFRVVSHNKNYMHLNIQILHTSNLHIIHMQSMYKLHNYVTNLTLLKFKDNSIKRILRPYPMSFKSIKIHYRVTTTSISRNAPNITIGMTKFSPQGVTSTSADWCPRFWIDEGQGGRWTFKHKNYNLDLSSMHIFKHKHAYCRNIYLNKSYKVYSLTWYMLLLQYPQNLPAPVSKLHHQLPS